MLSDRQCVIKMGAKLTTLADGKALYKAIQERRVEDIADAICRNPKILKVAIHTGGDTAWHCAVATGDMDTISIVSEAMESAVLKLKKFQVDKSGITQYISKSLNVANDLDQTPLMIACQSRCKDAALYLLAHGADPWLTDRLGKRVCLHYAAMAGADEVIVAVVSFVNRNPGMQRDMKLVDCKSSCGFTPLHYATHFKQAECVKALVESGADLHITNLLHGYEPVDCEPWSTALHIAATNGDWRSCSFILQAYLERGTRGVQEDEETTLPPDPRLMKDRKGHLPFNNALRQRHLPLAGVLHPAAPLTNIFNLPPTTREIGVPRLVELAAAVANPLLLNMIASLAPQAAERTKDRQLVAQIQATAKKSKVVWTPSNCSVRSSYDGQVDSGRNHDGPISFGPLLHEQGPVSLSAGFAPDVGNSSRHSPSGNDMNGGCNFPVELADPIEPKPLAGTSKASSSGHGEGPVSFGFDLAKANNSGPTPFAALAANTEFNFTDNDATSSSLEVGRPTPSMALMPPGLTGPPAGSQITQLGTTAGVSGTISDCRVSPERGKRAFSLRQDKLDLLQKEPVKPIEAAPIDEHKPTHLETSTSSKPERTNSKFSAKNLFRKASKTAKTSELPPPDVSREPSTTDKRNSQQERTSNDAGNNELTSEEVGAAMDILRLHRLQGGLSNQTNPGGSSYILGRSGSGMQRSSNPGVRKSQDMNWGGSASGLNQFLGGTSFSRISPSPSGNWGRSDSLMGGSPVMGGSPPMSPGPSGVPNQLNGPLGRLSPQLSPQGSLRGGVPPGTQRVPSRSPGSVVEIVRAARTPSGRLTPNGEPPHAALSVAASAAQLQTMLQLLDDAHGELDPDDYENSCGVCLDEGDFLTIERCGHTLCVSCAQELVKLQDFQPALCPFCRSPIKGFRVD